MRLTITDIARKAGVSKTTVSRVLNHRPDVDEETRKKILSIIEEFNYSPSFTAKSLSTCLLYTSGIRKTCFKCIFGIVSAAIQPCQAISRPETQMAVSYTHLSRGISGL